MSCNPLPLSDIVSDDIFFTFVDGPFSHIRILSDKITDYTIMIMNMTKKISEISEISETFQIRKKSYSYHGILSFPIVQNGSLLYYHLYVVCGYNKLYNILYIL